MIRREKLCEEGEAFVRARCPNLWDRVVIASSLGSIKAISATAQCNLVSTPAHPGDQCTDELGEALVHVCLTSAVCTVSSVGDPSGY